MNAERLSTDMQFFRQGMPVLLVIFAGCALMAVGFGADGFHGFSFVFAILVLAALVAALVWVHRTAARLAEAVDLDGDSLIVRRRGVEQRIPLAQIIDVRRDWLLQPGIALVLREPGPLGDRIRFLPSNAYFALNWQRNTIARRLDALVEQARRKEAAR